MNKNELKKLIKPVVKECIHEVLLEEGLLSNVVSEVVKGMNTAPLLETKTPTTKRVSNNDNDIVKKNLSEHRKKMLDAVGKNAYNGVDLFEGTAPLNERSAPGHPDLGVPGDSGVDISSLMGNASKIWQNMKQD